MRLLCNSWNLQNSFAYGDNTFTWTARYFCAMRPERLCRPYTMNAGATDFGPRFTANNARASATSGCQNKFLTKFSNDFVGEPVGRVSDEGGFWASTGDSPRAARQPRERQKPTEVGGGNTRVKPR